jgi:hypothetical protein
MPSLKELQLAANAANRADPAPSVVVNVQMSDDAAAVDLLFAAKLYQRFQLDELMLKTAAIAAQSIIDDRLVTTMREMAKRLNADAEALEAQSYQRQNAERAL